MGRVWITCEQCGGEWREEQGHDECPYCRSAVEKARQEAAEEWKRDQMKDRQYEDLGPDPRDYAYWERLM